MDPPWPIYISEGATLRFILDIMNILYPPPINENDCLLHWLLLHTLRKWQIRFQILCFQPRYQRYYSRDKKWWYDIFKQYGLNVKRWTVQNHYKKTVVKGAHIACICGLFLSSLRRIYYYNRPRQWYDTRVILFTRRFRR